MRLGDYNGGWLSNQTPGKLVLKGFGALLVIGVLCISGGFFLGWFKAGTDVIGPDNVREQFRFAYDYIEAADASGQNWCSIRQAELESTDPSVREQRTSQRLAIEMNYDRNIVAPYNARMDDMFRAGLVHPPDVPDRAPTLRETAMRLCPSVAQQ